MSLAAWNVGLSAAHRVKSFPPAVEARRTGITRHTCTASLERVVLMSVGPVVKISALFSLLAAFAFTLVSGQANAQTTLEIGIGIQNTTTNTVTGGAVLKELGLFEKHLPTTGKYKDFKYSLSWQNATSGPPITNGMMANNIQIGMMGDYPLMVNGATGQATGNETQLVAIIAYNAQGSGNGIVVHKDSPYFDLADLKGKLVSVPFEIGRAHV